MNNYIRLLSKLKIKKNFNNAAKTYDQHCQVQNKICANSLQLLTKYYKKFSTVADFACGSGESTKQIINTINYKTCYAIDFAENLLATAKNKLPSTINFIPADFDTKIFNDNYLDLIFCNMGLQWAENLAHNLNLFYKYLKQDGVILFSLPLHNNFPEIKNNYTLKTLKHENILKALDKTNFKIIEYLQITHTESFNNHFAILKSLKYVGATYYNNNDKLQQISLTRKHLQEIFVDSNTQQLTYNICIYLAKALK